jgi:hypothetical protein
MIFIVHPGRAPIARDRATRGASTVALKLKCWIKPEAIKQKTCTTNTHVKILIVLILAAAHPKKLSRGTLSPRPYMQKRRTPEMFRNNEISFADTKC